MTLLFSLHRMRVMLVKNTMLSKLFGALLLGGLIATVTAFASDSSYADPSVPAAEYAEETYGSADFTGEAVDMHDWQEVAAKKSGSVVTTIVYKPIVKVIVKGKVTLVTKPAVKGRR